MRKARNTVPDGPFERKIEAGIVGGAEGLAEQAQHCGEAVGERLREDVSGLLHVPNMA